jgi:hypothetical protein
MLKKIIFLILICLSYILAKGKFEAYLQPRFSVDENGSFPDSGNSSFDLHRIRTKLKYKKTLMNLEFAGTISLDFAEKPNEILEHGNIEMAIKPWLGFKFGQFKSSFGFESKSSSKDIRFIERGELSKYLRKSTGVSGYLLGAEVSGTFAKIIYYSAALCNNDGFSAVGGDQKVYINRILTLPIFSLGYFPLDFLLIKASLAIPYYGTLAPDNTALTSRYFFSDFAVKVNWKNYEGTAELFIGEDTSSTKKYLAYTSNGFNGISQGLSFSNSYTIPIKDKFSSLVSARFEYLNGLAFNGISYENRDFYYTLTGGLRASYTKKFWIDLNVSEYFDGDFKRVNNFKLALQCTAIFRSVIGK